MESNESENECNERLTELKPKLIVMLLCAIIEKRSIWGKAYIDLLWATLHKVIELGNECTVEDCVGES